MVDDIVHLHWPALVHEHGLGDRAHAHVVKGGCRQLPDVEVILFDFLGDMPDGQDGRFFAECPTHGAAR